MTAPRLIGMVHLLPILERQIPLDAVIERALTDARHLAEAGFDAIMVENFGDRPFYPDAVPHHTVAGLTRVAAAIRAEHPASGCALGINVLRNDAHAAIAVAAAVGADFIRVNVHIGATLTDQGILVGRAHETVRYRDRVAPGCLIFADVRVKHAAPLAERPIAEEARELYERGGADALIVSGAGTGAPTDPARLREVREAVPGCPIYVGSGATADTVEALSAWVDGYIVGTALKRDGEVTAEVDPARARAFVAAARAAQAARP